MRVEAVAGGVTVFFLAGALGAGWGGRLADHIGALRAMRRCVFITAAAARAAALAPSLAVLFALLAVAGVANSVTQPAINLYVAEQIPADRQGVGFGIKQSGIPAAILVSGLALPLLALPLGWRTTLALCALAPLAVALALPGTGSAHVSRRPPSRRPAGAAPHGARRRARHRGAERAGRLPGGVGRRGGDRRGHRRPARRARERAEPGDPLIGLGARADRARDYGLASWWSSSSRGRPGSR